MDFDRYLTTDNALTQTANAAGRLLGPGQEFDGMRVLAFLGGGAASEVWRVRDLKQNRDYTLKLFAPSRDTPDTARVRFLTEARALDEFRHPNLIRRYRLQEHGDHPYFTMDVLRPIPERLPEREIRRLLWDVLAGLEALHEKGIVHRDLKPSNILLDEAGHAILADLGVAHVGDADLARRLGDSDTPQPTLIGGSPFVGTPHYAAPEQLAGEAVSPATDIYALGVIIEQLFGGKLPHAWKMLVRRMTAARPGLRLQSVHQVRRRLRFLGVLPKVRRTALAVLLGVSALVTWQLAQPNWTELPETLAEVRKNPARLVITLDGGHYFQPKMHLQPLVGPAPTSALTATNAVDRQSQKMLSAPMRRYPVYVQGKGTLKCPDVTGCEIHLAPGVTFITTGRFRPDGYAIPEPTPPADADWTHRIGYPAYVVEKGAALIFTENDAYPAALIRRP